MNVDHRGDTRMVFRLEAERRKSRVGGTGKKRKEVEERSAHLRKGV